MWQPPSAWLCQWVGAKAELGFGGRSSGTLAMLHGSLPSGPHAGWGSSHPHRACGWTGLLWLFSWWVLVALAWAELPRSF